MRVAPVLLLLAACSGGNYQAPPPANVWEIGPTIDGKQYSTGSVDGDTIQIQDVHYITKATGPLAGTISVSFTLSAKLTATSPQDQPGLCGTKPATASIYFQRSNDDWNTDGNRWWTATTVLDHAGNYTLTAPLDGHWTSVFGTSDPVKFADAKLHAERVGFTIGNCVGLGHGGTGPATLTITAFSGGTA